MVRESYGGIIGDVSRASAELGRAANHPRRQKTTRHPKCYPCRRLPSSSQGLSTTV